MPPPANPALASDSEWDYETPVASNDDEWDYQQPLYWDTPFGKGTLQGDKFVGTDFNINRAQAANATPVYSEGAPRDLSNVPALKSAGDMDSGLLDRMMMNFHEVAGPQNAGRALVQPLAQATTDAAGYDGTASNAAINAKTEDTEKRFTNMRPWYDAPTDTQALGEFLAATVGSLGGALVDPTSLAGGVGKTALGTFGRNAAAGGAADVVAQVGNQQQGLKTEYDPNSEQFNPDTGEFDQIGEAFKTRDFSPTQVGVSAIASGALPTIIGGEAPQFLRELGGHVRTLLDGIRARMPAGRTKPEPGAPATPEEVSQILTTPEVKAVFDANGITQGDPRYAKFAQRIQESLNANSQRTAAQPNTPQSGGTLNPKKAGKEVATDIATQRQTQEGIAAGDINPGFDPRQGVAPEQPLGDVLRMGYQDTTPAGGTATRAFGEPVGQAGVGAREGMKATGYADVTPEQAAKIEKTFGVVPTSAEGRRAALKTVLREEADQAALDAKGPLRTSDAAQSAPDKNLYSPISEPNAAARASDTLGVAENRLAREGTPNNSASGTSDRPFRANDTGAEPKTETTVDLRTGKFGTRETPNVEQAADFEDRARAQSEQMRAESVSDLEARWEQARKKRAEDAGARTQYEERMRGAGEKYSKSKTSNRPGKQDAEERWPIDESGFVLSDKGGPVKFADQKQAARWILNEGQKKSPDQNFEIHNHPNGDGFTVREHSRTGKPGGSGGPGGTGAGGRDGGTGARDSGPRSNPEPGFGERVDAAKRALPNPESQRARDAGDSAPGGERTDTQGKSGADVPDDRAGAADAGTAGRDGPKASETRADVGAEDVARPDGYGKKRTGLGDDPLKEEPTVKPEEKAAFEERFTKEDGFSGEKTADGHPIEAGEPDAAKAAFLDMRAKTAERVEAYRADIEAGRRVAYDYREGFSVAVTPEPGVTGKYRLTTFDKTSGETVPSGHMVFDSAEEAARGLLPFKDKRLDEPPGMPKAKPEGKPKPVKFSANPFFDPEVIGPILKKEFAGIAQETTELKRAFEGGTVGSITQGIADVGRIAVTSVRGVMFAVRDRYAKQGNEAVAKILGTITDHLATDPGSGRNIPTPYEDAVRNNANSYGNRIANILSTVPHKELEAFGADIAQGKALKGEHAAVAGRVRKMLDEIHSYVDTILKDAAKDRLARAKSPEEKKAAQAVVDELKLGYTKNYFPRMVDEAKVGRDPTGFRRDVAKEYRRMGLSLEESEAAALRYYERTIGVQSMAYTQSLAPDAIKGRVFDKGADVRLNQWFNRNPAEVLPDYARRMVNFAEATKRFGINGEKLDAMFADAIREGMTDWDMAMFRQSTDSALGLMYRDTNTALDAGFAVVKTAGMLKLLPRAIWASLAEPIAYAARTGRASDALVAMTNTMRQIFDHGALQDKRDLAEIIGLAMSNHFHTMSTHFDIGGAPRTNRVGRATRYAQQNFFRRTGLQAYTDYSRVSGVPLMQAMIVRLLRDTDNPARTASAHQLLGDFGLGEKDVAELKVFLKSKNGNVGAADILESPIGRKYGDAVARGVLESIQEVKRVDKPIYANHPYIGLIYGITGFQRAFTRNMMYRTIKQTMRALNPSEKLTLADRSQLAVGPGLGLMLLLSSQYMVAKIRDQLTNSEQAKERPKELSAARYFSQSGVFMNFDPYINLALSAKYTSDTSQMLGGPYLASYMQDAYTAAQLLPPPFGKNSSNTQTAEYNAARAAYTGIISPSIALAASIAPGGPILNMAYGAVLVAPSGPTTGDAADAFATSIAGEKESKWKYQGAHGDEGGAGGGFASESKGIPTGGQGGGFAPESKGTATPHGKEFKTSSLAPNAKKKYAFTRNPDGTIVAKNGTKSYRIKRDDKGNMEVALI